MTSGYTKSKWFTIHKNDAGRETYRHEYVEWLEQQLAGGAGMIAGERQRQISVEGWTAEHDSGHEEGELAHAAICYAADEPIFVHRRKCVDGYGQLPHVIFQNAWPFDGKWYKPKSRIRDLVRAGALIAAEIDRLQREQNPAS